MPSILSEDDKETVRRMVPKASNKIQAVAVARLYVAYPNRHKWKYTGLQGAVVLSNDLVGNTYWLKLVDISVCMSRIYKLLEAEQRVGCKSRRHLGPRNLRNLELQSGSDLFPHFRDRGLLGRSFICRRKRSEDVHQENGRSGEECKQSYQSQPFWRNFPEQWHT